MRGTTADLHGFDDRAGRNTLMRFDTALELNKTYEKLKVADAPMRELIQEEFDRGDDDIAALHKLQSAVRDDDADVLRALQEHPEYMPARFLLKVMRAVSADQAFRNTYSGKAELITRKVNDWMVAETNDRANKLLVPEYAYINRTHKAIDQLENNRLAEKLQSRTGTRASTRPDSHATWMKSTTRQ